MNVMSLVSILYFFRNFLILTLENFMQFFSYNFQFTYLINKALLFHVIIRLIILLTYKNF